MFFSKRNKFLKLLFVKYYYSNEKIVKGTTLEIDLNLNYKKLHEIAKYWESQGCVVSRSERGGNLEYQLTSLGELAYEKVNKAEKSFKLLIVVIIFAIVAYFFI